jgi:hypothetical protein
VASFQIFQPKFSPMPHPHHTQIFDEEGALLNFVHLPLTYVFILKMKHSPKHPVLKHLQINFLYSHPFKTTGKIIFLCSHTGDGKIKYSELTGHKQEQ